MQPKTIKILYWVVTILFTVAMAMSGISNALLTKDSTDLMRHLQYPDYILYIVGVSKVVGGIVILQPKFKTLKEWAYAGMAIDLIGAMVSMLFVGDSIVSVSPMLVFVLFLFVSYFLWKKYEELKTA